MNAKRCAIFIVSITLLILAGKSIIGQSDCRIMPLGDSITESPFSYREYLWYRLEDSGLKIDYVGSVYCNTCSFPDKENEGHSGWRIDQIFDKIKLWMLIYDPDIILLHIGTNDIYQEYDLENASYRLGILIDKITEISPKTKIFVSSIIPFTEDSTKIKEFNRIIPGIISEKQKQGKNVYFVDMYKEAKLNPQTDYIDRIHPNISGGNKMGAVWYEHIMKNNGCG